MPTKALLKISHDMERVLNQLTAPKAPIDTVRKHGAKEFHGTSLEESDKEGQVLVREATKGFGL